MTTGSGKESGPKNPGETRIGDRWRGREHGCFGLLVPIPTLHLSAIVREDIIGKALQLAVGHAPATPLPGQAGNLGLAGRRDSFLHGLMDLRTKDGIHSSTLFGSFSYTVESLLNVEPANVGVPASSSEIILTLVTCYPFSYVGAAPSRFIV